MENKPKKKKKSSIKPAPVNLLGQKRNKPKKRSDIRYKDKNEKQREYRDRKENGYLYLVSSGTEIETIAFLKQYVNCLLYTSDAADE